MGPPTEVAGKSTAGPLLVQSNKVLRNVKHECGNDRHSQEVMCCLTALVPAS